MPEVTIAGLGLIGGSIGMALRRSGWRVLYVDPSVGEEEAMRAGAADERADGRASSPLVVIATPVDTAVELVHKSAGGGLRTSTCSVMAPLRHAGQGSDFVAGHPFAGSERSGLAAARDDLFHGRPWFVDRDTPQVREMIEATGAHQVVVDAREHDEAMAFTSHLPQVLSTALASLVEKKKIDPQFVGSGLRTFLRLAASPYDVWSPVLEANGANLQRALDELLETAAQLDERDFDRAQKFLLS